MEPQNKKTAIAKQIMHKKPPSILVAKESPFCHFSYFVFAGNFLLLFSWSLVTNFLKFLFDRRSLPIVRRECSPLTFAEKVKSDVWSTKGRVTLPKRLNFRKGSKRGGGDQKNLSQSLEHEIEDKKNATLFPENEGGSMAVWNFSENSFVWVWVVSSVPNTYLAFTLTH